MKTVICYYSRHHGNTLKVLEAMAREGDADLIDVTGRMLVRLEDYDAVGFASGIYYGHFHETVTDYLRNYLPRGKDVFFVYTCGAKRKGYTDAIAAAAAEKSARVLGEFSCPGWDTFGPFRLIGGIAKGRPSGEDLAAAAAFYRSLSGKS